MRIKRENWGGKYYVVQRDDAGRFIHRGKWTRKTLNSFWVEKWKVKPPPPLVKKGLWTKVTAYYEARARNSWHIDAGICRLFGDVEEMEEELKKMILKKMGWKDSWESFEVATGGCRFGVGYEVDGVDEVWCEVWRV